MRRFAILILLLSSLTAGAQDGNWAPANIPHLTTATRPTLTTTTHRMIWNATTGQFEGWTGTAWIPWFTTAGLDATYLRLDGTTDMAGVFKFQVVTNPSPAPTFEEGGVYYQTTQNKLYAGIGTAWDEVMTLTYTDSYVGRLNYANTWGATGAASAPAALWTGAWYSGGTGTTTTPHILIQPSTATAATTWSTSGTGLGINADVAAGNLIDARHDGQSRLKVDLVGNLVYGPVLPAASAVTTATGGAGSVPVGTHYYRVTYVHPGGETAPGTYVGSYVVAGPGTESVSLSAIPVSPDPNVTARKIYRNTGVAIMYLLTTINDNTTTTYSDDTADVTLNAKMSWTGTAGGSIYDGATRLFAADQTSTIIGYGATPYNYGASNTVLGYRALGGSSGATNYAQGCVAVGTNSMISTTNAIDVTAVGQGSFINLTTGRAGVAVGNGTLAGVTTGNYNTGVGFQAGYANATGASNIFLGYGAGSLISGGGSNTTPSTSIYIGNNTRGLNNNDANQVVIGDSMTGRGPNTVVLGNGSVVNSYLSGTTVNIEGNGKVGNGTPTLAQAGEDLYVESDLEVDGRLILAGGTGGCATALQLGAGEVIDWACGNARIYETSNSLYLMASGGPVYTNRTALTSAAMTKVYSGAIQNGWSKYTWTAAMVAAGRTDANTSNVQVCTLPAKTVVRRAYLVTAAAPTGVTTPTVSLGRTAAAYIDFCVATAPGVNTVIGDALAEIGAVLKNAAADAPIEDFAGFSLAGTTAVYCQFTDDGGADINAWTGGTGTVYLETYTLP